MKVGCHDLVVVASGRCGITKALVLQAVPGLLVVGGLKKRKKGGGGGAPVRKSMSNIHERDHLVKSIISLLKIVH